MPRRRTLAIREPVHVLRRYESEAADRTARLRIAALRILKESPSLTISELSDLIECPVRTIMNWLTVYRHRGFEGVLAIGSHCMTIPPSIEHEVEQRLAAGEFRTTKQIRSWLLRTHDIRMSVPAVTAMINRRSRVPTKHDAAAATASAPTFERVDDVRIGRWLYDFTCSLPERITSREWIDAFKLSLASLFDVERVTVSINLRAVQPKPVAPTLSIAIRELLEGGAVGPSSLTVTSIERSVPRSVQVIDELVEQGLKLDCYHEPFAQDFHLTDGSYLGTIILWQPITNDDIALFSKATLVQMRHVLSRLMLDCAARHEQATPSAIVFFESLARLVVECKLTPTEEKVMTMQVLGHSYSQIAAELKTSEANVGRHLSSVHKKTGASGKSDLQARLFAPRVA